MRRKKSEPLTQSPIRTDTVLLEVLALSFRAALLISVHLKLP
jgi:hypothetical protein